MKVGYVQEKEFRTLGYVWGIAPALLVMINVLSGAKLVQLGPVDLGWFSIPGIPLAGGTVLFPLTYVLDDMITEVYGFKNAQRIIWTSFAALLFGFFAIPLVQALPSAGLPYLEPHKAAEQQAAFSTALGLVPRVNIASIIAVLAGRFVNSGVMTLLKAKTGEKLMGTRFVVSTIAGEAVDTVLFLSIAFIGTETEEQLVFLCISQYCFKVLWEIAALPLSTKAVRMLKRAEGLE